MQIESGSHQLLGPPPAKRCRRPALFNQADITRALRAVRQVGGDYSVRVEPDGSIVIGRLSAQIASIASKSQPVRDFHL